MKLTVESLRLADGGFVAVAAKNDDETLVRGQRGETEEDLIYRAVTELLFPEEPAEEPDVVPNPRERRVAVDFYSIRQLLTEAINEKKYVVIEYRRITDGEMRERRIFPLHIDTSIGGSEPYVAARDTSSASRRNFRLANIERAEIVA